MLFGAVISAVAEWCKRSRENEDLRRAGVRKVASRVTVARASSCSATPTVTVAAVAIPDHGARDPLRALPGGERRAVKRAVAMGKALADDRRLAWFAVVHARRVQAAAERPLPGLGLMRLGFMYGFGWVVLGWCVYLAIQSRWEFAIAFIVIGVGAQWMVGRVIVRTAARAEAANLAVVRERGDRPRT
jgi:hypothetical protein